MSASPDDRPGPPSGVKPGPHRALTPVTGFFVQVAAVLCGAGMAVQSRVNGELGTRTGDPTGASLVSFGTGLVVVIALAVALPKGRAGARELAASLREKRLPYGFLLSGVFGAFLVLVQTFTTPLAGVAVFILGVVVGQSLGGLAVDRIGFGPGGAKPLTGWRIVGTAVIVAAVVLAQWPRFSAGQGNVTTAGPGLLAVLALLQILAGVGVAVQTAMNGRTAQEARTPITSTLVNFAGGALGLTVTAVVYRAVAELPAWHFPQEWWLYTGGVVGLVFVGAGAVLARVIGVLRTSLSLTAGMLSGALVLDLLAPTAGTLIVPLTVVGTLLTFVGLVMVTLPWKRR